MFVAYLFTDLAEMIAALIMTIKIIKSINCCIFKNFPVFVILAAAGFVAVLTNHVLFMVV